MDEDEIFLIYVNGVQIADKNIDPEWTLLYYLRRKLRHIGTKLGCAEGGCGACTVMVSRFDWLKKKIVHYAVNACLMPVCALHGTSVTTVEGIGNSFNLHPVQDKIAKNHGTQCGFCTPGIVMSMYSLLRSCSDCPSMQDIENSLQGNLCRCTGYRPIIEGFRSFTKLKDGSPMSPHSVDSNESDESEVLGRFPAELAVSDYYNKRQIIFKGPRVTCYRPVDLEELLSLKNEYPFAKIINGNTEVGIETKFKHNFYPILILANVVRELCTMTVEERGVRIGASSTLTDLEDFLNDLLKKEESYRCKIYESILEILPLFAGKQIRNVAAIGGNIMTASPISDINPILMACEAKLEFKNLYGSREVVMNEKFWAGYRKTVAKPNEVLCSIFIPFTEENQYFKAYKQSRRRDDDISIVNAAFFLELDGCSIRKINMVFGGMGPTTISAKITADRLIRKKWNNEMLEEALASLMEELTLSPSAPGGMILYRRSLVLSFFFKFYLYISCELEKLGLPVEVESSFKSGKDRFETLDPSSFQFIPKPKNAKNEHDMTGRSIAHQSAYRHATGEALYCDDMPALEDELFLSLFTSTRPYAKIKKIDVSEAWKVKGVIGFVTANDIPGQNRFGPIELDEEIFASKEVYCHGQVIGGVVAGDQVKAQRAANLVKVEYEDLKPVIITTQEAIAHKSFFPSSPLKIKSGNLRKGFAKSDDTVEGELTIGGQEHFYLETHSAVAIPLKEDGELEIYASSQHPTEVQNLVAQALGIPNHKVVCKVKRMGGGFGGKESRSVWLALCTAIAAYKFKRPVRAMFDRKEDMIITGHRHPFYGKYKAGFDKEGKIKACEFTLYCNAGCTKDLSDAVMERACFHVQNTLHIENILIKGYVCKTNLPSNTAFRGFGAPQAMLLGETMVHHIAEKLGMDVDRVHTRNCYTEGDLTPFKQKIYSCTIVPCWNKIKNKTGYLERKAKVIQFNKENRFRKRGIALIPTMFGIGFSTRFLNQAGALVLVYRDGSVLISHGGTEMGQGLHSKMIQVASRALGISVMQIHISETSTNKVPNTSATAGSSSSDLNGMAVLNACQIINSRLKPIKEKYPEGPWESWVEEAYVQRISLAASGFYKSPYISSSKLTTGSKFYYHTGGVACSEVEIDCLTGDHQVLQTDIVMDVGQSINPAIDIGQIEGAFMQGYGLFTMEELVYSPDGALYTTGPGTYKIPTVSDMPGKFNVYLLKHSFNQRAIYSSKGIGEPPLFLASSVFFAIRKAVMAARKDNNIEGWFTFDSPATCARIRLACTDKILEKLTKEPVEPETWSVIV